MSPSEKINDYARGWTDLMKLVRNGHSWSGSERNRFFLNGRKGRFHEMSHLAGLDHIEDGRGLAIVDWDQDGRLDLWYRNRSGPRLRLMLNQRKSPPSVSIKLEGTSSNRDAIGAVVELLPSQGNKHLVRSVKAGDLFLSQSSKWLHFGLGDRQGYRQAKVTWPGGGKELFEGLNGDGGRFLLKQGTGKATAMKKRKTVTLKQHPLEAAGTTSQARIILPARVPFPLLTFRDQAAKQQLLAANGKARLLVLWSGTCNSCKDSLEEFTSNADKIRAANLEILALAINGIGGPIADISPAYNLIDRTKFPFPWGLIDAESANRIHKFQEKLFDHTPPSSVPLAILLDPNNRALTIYRGEISTATILQDWQALQNANATQLHHFAPPMSGTWFTNPLPQGEVERLFKASK